MNIYDFFKIELFINESWQDVTDEITKLILENTLLNIVTLVVNLSHVRLDVEEQVNGRFIADLRTFYLTFTVQKIEENEITFKAERDE
jgi:hypothetical protein